MICSYIGWLFVEHPSHIHHFVYLLSIYLSSIPGDVQNGNDMY